MIFLFSFSFTDFDPGANPTIASYNARAVKIYNATNSLVPFENRNHFLKFEETLYSTYNASVVLVNFEVVGLAPVFDDHCATTQVLIPVRSAA
jgi:hypothetical protein